MVFATDYAPDTLMHRAHCWVIRDLAAEDYEAIWSAYLDPAAVRRMKFPEIHQFAPGLNAHQLRKAAEWLAQEPGADTGARTRVSRARTTWRATWRSARSRRSTCATCEVSTT